MIVRRRRCRVLGRRGCQAFPVTFRNVVIALTVVVAAVTAGALWYEAPAPTRTAPEAALISALADDLATVEPGDPPVALASADARCVAEAIVDGIELSRLAALSVDAAAVRAGGFDPSTVRFTPAERAVVVDAFDACVDLTELAVASLAHTGGQAAQECVREALPGPRARALWRWRVGPTTDAPPPGLAEVLATVDACLG